MTEHIRPDDTVDQTPSRDSFAVDGSVLRALGAAAVQLRDSEAGADTPVRRIPAGASLADGAGRYELHGEIARGGMGAVLKGRDTDLGREVAIKVLLEAHQGRTELVQRFVEEAQVGGQLQHPGVVPVYELGQLPDQRPYFTMKLVQGRTLAKLLAERARGAPTDLPRLLKIFEQVCQTLAYAHSRGVIHRDLKPSNIMVGTFGEVQVMDWGLAKVLNEGAASRGRQPPEERTVVRTRRSAGPDDASKAGAEAPTQTEVGTVLGTPAYMAPEQARGEVEALDARSDVFGLGALLCEILTGKPPYTGTEGEVSRQASAADLAQAFVRLDVCGADAELIGLARRCLAAEPAERFPDAAALAATLTNYRESVEARLRQAELDRAAAQAKAQEERKRRRTQLALGVSLLTLIVAGGGGWFWVAQERAAREAEDARLAQERERQITAELGRALVLREQAKAAQAPQRRGLAAEALAAAQRADVLAADEHANPELRQRVAALVNELGEAECDRRMAERLIQIREDQAQTGDNVFNEGSADTAYAQAFRDYAIDPEALPAADFAARLRARAIAPDLIAALDNWIMVRRFVTRPDDPASWQPLIGAARAADPEPWRDRLRAAFLRPERDRELLRELAATADVNKQPPQVLYHLAVVLSGEDVPATVALLRKAQQRYPDEFFVNSALAYHLHQAVRPRRLDEALRFQATCVALRPRTAGAHYNLGRILVDLGRDEEALKSIETAIALKADYAEAHDARGRILARQGKYEEAIKAHRHSFNLKKRTVPLENLAWALEQQGKYEQAEAVDREAIALDPDDPRPYFGLENVLRKQKRYADAIKVCREILTRLDKARRAGLKDRSGWSRDREREAGHFAAAEGKLYNDLAWLLSREKRWDEALEVLATGLRLRPQEAHLYLVRGNILKDMGRLDDAADAYVQAVRCRADYHLAHLNLGLLHAMRGQLEDAVPVLQRAAALKPDDPRVWFGLAQAREEMGRYAAAALAWRQGLAVLPPEDSKRSLFEARQRQAENWAALDRPMPRILKGEVKPASAAQWAGYFQFAYATKRYVAAARLFKGALADWPEVGADPRKKLRYLAASAAAQAGSGTGKDAHWLDNEGRATWRQQARDWLRQDLGAFAQLADGGSAPDRALVQAACRHWQSDPALAGVRERAALRRLPAEERDAWGQLWDDVEQLWMKAGGGK
jgi:serine/threonine-protein kinase